MYVVPGCVRDCIEEGCQEGLMKRRLRVGRGNNMGCRIVGLSDFPSTISPAAMAGKAPNVFLRGSGGGSARLQKRAH